MSGIRSHVEARKQGEQAKQQVRDAMRRGAQEAAESEQGSRAARYVDKEKAALKKDAKLAEANRSLRQG